MIAISYRREDSTPVAGRLHDRLRAEFGKENVFMDFDSIPYGVDFRDHIAQTLEAAEVLVAVIGPGWLGQRVDESTRRIDDPTDFVRLEIAGALQRGIPVIPVLVDKTPMPKQDTLPSDLKPLVFRNALMLDTGIDFHHHADRLIKGIRGLLKNVQSASRRGYKERSRGSSGFTRDPDHGRAAASRFKWFGIFDRPQSPAPSRQDDKSDAKPAPLTSAAESVSAAPNETVAQSRGTEAAAPETALSQTSQSTEADLDFERYVAGRSDQTEKQPAPSQPPDQECGAKPTSLTSAAESVTAAPKPASAQSGGTGARASDALAETTQVTEKDLDFERYGGGSRDRAEKQSAPPASSISESAPSVMASAASVKESSIAPPPTATAIAQPSSALEKPHRLFFNGKLIWLVLAGAFIGFVTYFVVTSKIKSTSGGAEKVLSPAVPATQASPLITPESSVVPSSTIAPDSSQSASKISPIQESTPSKATSEETAASTTSDQTPMASPSPEVATTTPAPQEAPLARNGRTWQAWIGDFVRQFVAANQSKDANATLALYAPTVDYFDDHHADQAFIRQDIEKYNERWPVRQDSVEGDIHLQEKVPEKDYVANFKLNFHAESVPRAIWTKGQFAIDLDITVTDGIPKISGIKEKMLHQQKGKPGSTPTSNAPRRSYASGIPIQGKPGFVRSPYAPSKGELDIRRYPKGAQLKCPFTGKIFIAP